MLIFAEKKHVISIHIMEDMKHIKKPGTFHSVLSICTIKQHKGLMSVSHKLNINQSFPSVTCHSS
jgi:hypothetical protein